jgi:hypothetical protein
MVCVVATRTLSRRVSLADVSTAVVVVANGCPSRLCSVHALMASG